jgi:hypothetical protein
MRDGHRTQYAGGEARDESDQHGHDRKPTPVMPKRDSSAAAPHQQQPCEKERRLPVRGKIQDNTATCANRKPQEEASLGPFAIQSGKQQGPWIRQQASKNPRAPLIGKRNNSAFVACGSDHDAMMPYK